MGQAKQRGTFEERKSAAQPKQAKEKPFKLREITINGLSQSQINLANLAYGKAGARNKVKLANSKIGKEREVF